MLDLKKLVKDYEDSARSFSELVPWMAQISPHMVINKDGSLLVCYTYDGIDSEGQERYETDRATMLTERALRVFDEKMTIWFTVDRRRTKEYPEGEFKDKFSDFVNQKWKTQFLNGSQYVNKYYLAVVFKPPGGIEGAFEKMTHYLKVEGLSFVKALSETVKSSIFKKNAFSYEASQLLGFIEEFDDKVSAFEQTASDLSMRRLEREDLLVYLHDRCSPASQGQRVVAPRIPAYLDSHLPSDTLVSRDDLLHIKGYESCWIGGVSVKDWPDLTEPGLLDGILAIPGELTFSQVMRIESHDKAKKYITDIERHNRNMEKSIKSYMIEAFTHEESRQRDSGRVMRADDAHEAATDMTTESRVYGYYNLTVLVYGKTRDEAEVAVKTTTQLLRKNGFITVRENMHLLSAFCGTLPGQAGALVRWHFVSTANLADLAPVRTLGIGQKTNTHYTEQLGYKTPPLTVLSTEFSIPYYFNFHQADLAHTLVVGPSRTGKSSFNNFLISQFQKYMPCHTFIFDKDYSCRIPTILQGGTHVDLAGDHERRVSINPMLLVENKEDWPWLAKWLENLFTARGYELTVEDDRIIWKAIESISVQSREMWKLQHLVPLLSIHLHEQLDQWVGKGQRAHYFDNDEDTFELGHFTCVEMGGLFQDEVVARAFLEYAFYRISKRLDGKPALIYVEEAWFMLAEPQFAKKINDWLRTLAKKNAFLIMATQSLDEVSRSDIFATIIDNIPNRIYLPNPNAYAHREMYKNQFGLNNMQIDRIRNGIPKLHYYIVTPRLSRMAEVRLTPEILAVVRSDSRAQKVFSKHQASGVDDWKVNYVEEIIGHE
jgi:type IV secretion system protein VirB4